MKMYKRIFGVLLCLCMLLGAVSLASAEGETAEGGQTEEGQTEGGQTHENHPICGATHTDIGDHKGECPDLEWTKLYMDEGGKLCYGDGTEVTQERKSYMLGEGAYYLGDDVVVSNTIKITGNVSLCLNGKTLSFSTNSNAFPNDDSNQRGGLLWITNGKTLSICDCGNNGSVELSRVDSGGGAKYSTVYSADNSTLNLYGGAIKRTNDSTQGAAITLARVSKAAFNMYGGTISNTSTNYFADAVSVYQIQMGEDETCAINIYDGSVEAVKGGIDTTEGEKIEVLIAGGSIICNGTSGYAVNVSSGTALILSGSPTLKGADADIYLPANSHFTVTDDFTIGTDSVISVMQALGSSEKGVFAKPAASGSSLAEKAKYFVSAETGYCVTTSGNDLQLTPCQITEQPTVADATVVTNGTPTYRWYAATRDDVPVTNKNAMDEGNYYRGEEWSIFKSAASISNEPIFSIDMKKGDTLTLSYEEQGAGITKAALYIGDEEKTTGIITEDETEWWKKQCTLTAPADGDYTLRLSGSGYSGEGYAWTSLSFTATVTGDVPDTEQQPVSTGATLDTSNLCGPYICRVTWQGKTDKGTTIIDSDPVTLDKNHTAAAATRENENPATCTADGSYDEVVKCSRCGAEISRTSKTIPAKGHTGGTATCTEKAICETCGQPYGNALDHSWDAGTITMQPTCEGKGVKTFKCTRQGCTVTTTEEISATGHDFTGDTYLSNGTQHWKKCKNCDATNTPVDHNVVTDKAKPATTTETGLTEGKHCDVCGKVLVAQEVTPKLTPRYYYNSTTTTTKDTTKKDNTESPSTFDPGVGVYALTAVLSVTGMAWVGRKKH